LKIVCLQALAFGELAAFSPFLTVPLPSNCPQT
jgi:hypothetical protein